MEDAAELVGRTLHYIGDSTIISPSIDEDMHNRMERDCSRIRPRQVIENLNLFKPIGKRETLKMLVDSLEKGPASSALEAVKRTLALSFSIISSTLSSPIAPKGFRELGARCHEYFKREKNLMLPLSLSLIMLPYICLILLGLELRFAVALASLIFTIIPSMAAGISGMIMYVSQDMNTALHSARRVYGMLPWIVVGTAISSLIVFSIGYIIAITLLIPEIFISIMIYRRLFNILEWRRVKDEIDWFRWT